MESLVPAKIRQAAALLEELGLDMWLIFVRETSLHRDPTMDLVVGHDVTWQSAFFYTRSGRAISLVGNFDEANFRNAGFSEVRSYTAGVKEDLLAILDELQPAGIALNYSTDDVAADGLTHGMYELLCDYLEDTPYAGKFLSSEQLVMKLRGRKLPEEVDRLRAAAVTAERIWQATVGEFRIGMTEKEIAARLEQNMAAAGVEPSFVSIVNAGDKTDPGHGLPSDAKLEAGDLLHVDFGVRLHDYCSDLQRLVYFRRPHEAAPPEELREAFTVVRDIITTTAAACRPGVPGFEIDTIARRELRDHGYPEYEHALGHQLGRNVHDGGGILGPLWERYGRTPEIRLETGNVFTLELEINLPGIGCVGLEEDVHVTDQGAQFLCPRQMELIIV